MNFYELYAETIIEDYAEPGDGLNVLARACRRSEFQFLDRTALDVELSAESGRDFPDFICRDAVPLVSEKFRRALYEAGVDNLFFKRIYLTAEDVREPYWLALPPRIDCLDMKRSVVEVEDNEFLEPDELLREVKKISIDVKKIGNYKIFKLPVEFENQEIVVTESLKSALEEKFLSNVHFRLL